MQHAYGAKFHRTTVWRRLKAGGQPAGKGGRRLSDDRLLESLLLFVGAVVTLWNRRGFVNYGNIFQGPAQGRAGFRYYRVPKRLFQNLARSGFPPQLLAVVVADVVPLNLITQGGPNSASRRDLPWLARLGDSAPLAREDDHFLGRIPDAKLVGLDAVSEPVYEPDIYGEIDERLGWQEPDQVKASPLPVAKHFRPVKGTPVYRVEFRGGVRISRPMVCYWKNDRRRDYLQCSKFVESLLKKPLPVAPYMAHVATQPKLNNARFIEFWADRQRRRAAGEVVRPLPELTPKMRQAAKAISARGGKFRIVQGRVAPIRPRPGQAL